MPRRAGYAARVRSPPRTKRRTSPPCAATSATSRRNSTERRSGRRPGVKVTLPACTARAVATTRRTSSSAASWSVVPLPCASPPSVSRQPSRVSRRVSGGAEAPTRAVFPGSARATRARGEPARAARLLLARHHGDGLALEVDVRLAADVDRDAVDRAAGEAVRRGARVVVRDGVAAVASDAQAVAGERELARLGLDPALADLLVAVEERQRADRHAGRILSVLLEGGGEDQVLAGREVTVGDDPLFDAADEVVDVVQAVVLDVQGVAAEARAVREQRTLRAGGGGVDDRRHRGGAGAGVWPPGLGHVGDPGVVDVPVPCRTEQRPRRAEDLERSAVVERERAVGAGLRIPQVDHLPEALGLVGGEVVRLRAVDVRVVELPRVRREVAPAGDRGGGGDGRPAVMPDAARAEH